MILGALFGGVFGSGDTCTRGEVEEKSSNPSPTMERLLRNIDSPARRRQVLPVSASLPFEQEDFFSISGLSLDTEIRFFPAFKDKYGNLVDTHPRVECNGWAYRTVQIRTRLPRPAPAPKPVKLPEVRPDAVVVREEEAQTEVIKDLEKAHADRLTEHGIDIKAAQISLIWEDKSDLDLHLVCPNKETVYYPAAHKKHCGFRLKVDKNAGGVNLTNTPIEDIILETESRLRKVNIKYMFIITEIKSVRGRMITLSAFASMVR